MHAQCLAYIITVHMFIKQMKKWENIGSTIPSYLSPDQAPGGHISFIVLTNNPHLFLPLDPNFISCNWIGSGKKAAGSCVLIQLYLVYPQHYFKQFPNINPFNSHHIVPQEVKTNITFTSANERLGDAPKFHMTISGRLVVQATLLVLLLLQSFQNIPL